MGIVFYVGKSSDDNTFRLTDRSAKLFLPLLRLDPDIVAGTVKILDPHEVMQRIKVHRRRLAEHRIYESGRGRLSAQERRILLGGCATEDVLDWLQLLDMVARDADMARRPLKVTRRRIRNESRRRRR